MTGKYSATPEWMTHILKKRVKINSYQEEIKRWSNNICGTVCEIVAGTPMSAIYNYNLEDASSSGEGSGGCDD